MTEDQRTDATDGPSITIIGLGPIGVAIGRALKRVRTDYTINAHDRDPKRVKAALNADAADDGDWNVVRSVQSADLVILTEPFDEQLETIGTIAEHVRPGALIAGVSSRLSPLLAVGADTVPDGVSFIATHPVPSSHGWHSGEQTAVDAEGDMTSGPGPLQGATWCVAPSPSASAEAVRVFGRLVTAVGAQPLFIDVDEHDALVAGASRLPRIAYAALARVIARSPSAQDLRRLVDPALRDLLDTPDPSTASEISGDPAMLVWLDQLLSELNEIRSALADGDKEAVRALFDEADAARAIWSARPGAPSAEIGRELREIGKVRNLLFGRRKRPKSDESAE